MAMAGASASTVSLSRSGWRSGALALALVLTAGCGSGSGPEPGPPPPPPPPPPPGHVVPTGRLLQTELRGPITHTSVQGWRLRIEGGAVTIRPPQDHEAEGHQYVAWRMREQLGTHDLRAWSGTRRTVLLPGGTKVTMHGQAGEILRLSIFDGDESHEVDVLTQTLMHSQVDAARVRARDAAEADGETAQLSATSLERTIVEGRDNRLLLSNVYVQDENVDGTPGRIQTRVLALGQQIGADLHVHAPPPAAAPDADESCSTDQPRGRLIRLGNNSLQYATSSGQWLVTVHGEIITATRSGWWTWEDWGTGHENLNGKHIKDVFAARRTLLLDDGTKITLHWHDGDQTVHTTQIIDGAQSHEIGNAGMQLRHSCVNAEVARERDIEEADGETAYLVHLRSPASLEGYLHVVNVYDEPATPEGVGERQFEALPLGSTGEADIDLKQINDYYDDPRIGHT